MKKCRYTEHRYCPACGIELKETGKREENADDKVNILKLEADYLKLKKRRLHRDSDIQDNLVRLPIIALPINLVHLLLLGKDRLAL